MKSLDERERTPTKRSSVINENCTVNGNTSADCPSPRLTDADDATTTELSDDDTPNAQHLQVLKGVTAYVEVRTSNDNRSHAISSALRHLGAVVVNKFTDDVTHVIYKEGKKRTRDKASKKNVHLVSVLWVDSCRKNKEHVSEKLFPAIVPETIASPVPFGRLKKMKSMQPTDFADDLVGSAERCEKRRKRVATMRRFQVAEDTPEYTPPTVLVQETQPRSGPQSCGIPSSSRWTTPMSLTIPDTPPSMREKLREMKLAKLNGTNFSPLARPGDMEPLIRKLFANECISQEDMESFEDEDPLPSRKSASSPELENTSNNSSKAKKMKKLLTKPVKPSSFLVEPTHCSSEERPGLLESEKRPGSRGRKKSSLDGPGSGHVKRDDDPGSGPVMRAKKGSVAQSEASTPVHGSGQCIDDSHSGPVKRPGRARVIQEPGSGPSKRGRKRKAEDNVDTADNEIQNHKKTRCDEWEAEEVSVRTGSGHEKGKAVQRRRSMRGRDKDVTSSMCVTDSNMADSPQTDATMTTLSETDRSRVLGASMSAVFDNTAMLGLSTSRRSIDEFSICKPRRKGPKDVSSKLTSIQECNVNASKSKPKSCHNKQKKACTVPFQSSSASGDDEATETSISDVSNIENVPKPSQIKLRRANSFGQMEKSTSLPNTSLSSRHRPSLVMTSLHTHEQETIISIVKKLGCFLMHDNVNETTTHVVYGDPRRTLNILAAIARGCWLLRKEWVFKSIEAGHWLDEEEYECSSKFPQAKIARQDRQSAGDEYRQTLFVGCGQMFVSNKCVPPRGSLINLLTLCGGQMTNSISRCSVYIGPEGYAGKTSVKPVWVLDCIMEQKLIPYDNYKILAAKERESSPEF